MTTEQRRHAERCARGRILVVDDDPEILAAFRALFELEGYACETHAAAAELLAALVREEAGFPGPCCLLCDVMMPGQNGLELQRHLAARPELPMILMSGVSGASEVADAFRAGAVDFLIKPIDADELLAVVVQALERGALAQQTTQRQRMLNARCARLTAREREVAERVVRGQPNLAIAAELGIALRTVKRHRQQVMQKLEVGTLADLVRLMDETERIMQCDQEAH
jgi:FixJ family two-component response regulator